MGCGYRVADVNNEGNMRFLIGGFAVWMIAHGIGLMNGASNGFDLRCGSSEGKYGCVVSQMPDLENSERKNDSDAQSR